MFQILTKEELLRCFFFFFSDSCRNIAILRPAQNLSKVKYPSAFVTFFKLVTIPFGKCSSLSLEFGDHLSAISGNLNKIIRFNNILHVYIMVKSRSNYELNKCLVI